jgi:phage-like element PBSX protein xkdQ|nr:MAG TPA: 43 kDa tail protein [Caudoviricetes sp.]
MLKIIVNNEEHIKKFERIIWKGGINGTSRTLEVKYLDDATIAKLGDKVEFYVDEDKLFTGKVFSVEVTGQSQIKTFNCFDNSIYLNKNYFVKNFNKKKPSQILKEICGELKLEVGTVPKDIVDCTYPAINRSGYQIILNAYTIQHRKDKKIYSIVSNDGKIEVIEQGALADVLLHSEQDIKSSKYGEDIEKMVNQIVIYKTEKEKQQIVDKVENKDDKEKYGLFQKVMQYDKDRDNINNAKEMLKSVEKTGNITCLGNILIQSGYSIGIHEPHTNLVGSFLVKNDTHIWENDVYYCDVELAFENVMDKTEFEDKPKSKKSKKSKSKKSKKTKKEKEGKKAGGK